MNQNVQHENSNQPEKLSPYQRPELKKYGGISQLTEGELAYAAEEGLYQQQPNMTGP